MEALSPEVADVADEDIRTIGRKGTGRGRVEVLARERRRTWTRLECPSGKFMLDCKAFAASGGLMRAGGMLEHCG
jgi:hypothetical protein